MKRFYTLFALFSFIYISLFAEIPTGYYNRLDGKKKEQLKEAAYTTIRPHTVVTYNSLFPQQFPQTDVYPDLYNGQKRWWDMYSNDIFLVKNGWSGMNREHSFPKSWWGGQTNEAYTDLFHLYPSESEANMAKNNYPLGVVQTATFDNGTTKVGYAIPGNGGGATKVFEPADEYKGDFARTYFYIVTCYQDYTWKYTYMAKNGAYPSLQPWAVDMLLDWARKDPVSPKEKDRNEAVYKIQGNRNPYIDFPEFAEYVWGSRSTEIFYLKDQGGEITPPITGDPELFAPADGSTLDFGQVAVGYTQTTELLVNGNNLTSALSVRVTGKDRDMFKLTGITANQIPASSINSESGYKLTINYSPTSIGEHTAAITLYDGGFPSGTNFNVQIHGECFPIPHLSVPTALQPSEITDTSYTANWQISSEDIDYYILNRTRYLPGNITTTHEITEENRFEIDDRQADIAESYTVQSVRLGILSEESNMIMVAAGNISETAMPQLLHVTKIEGGICIQFDEQQTDFQICDLTGKTLVYSPIIFGEHKFTLPGGVYLLNTLQNSRPVKVIIH